MEPEILITISLRLPQADRNALADHLKALMHMAVVAGGDTVHIGLQPYTPDEDEEL